MRAIPAGAGDPTADRSLILAPGHQVIFDDSPEDRRQTPERRWQIGGFEFLGAYTDPVVTHEANDILADFVRDKIAKAVQDPETVAKLQPRSHPIMAKRPTVSTAYYETFNRPNVELVDLKADALVEITEKGVRTESGEFEVDVLVMATGYDAVTGPLVRLGIEGRDGVKLAEEWADGARSYLGLAIAGFPILFTITGPLSATPLINVVRSIEHHVEWIVSCLEHLRTAGASTIEAWQFDNFAALPDWTTRSIETWLRRVTADRLRTASRHRSTVAAAPTFFLSTVETGSRFRALIATVRRPADCWSHLEPAEADLRARLVVNILEQQFYELATADEQTLDVDRFVPYATRAVVALIS